MQILKENKRVIVFLTVFVGSYFLLSAIYHWYLSLTFSPGHYPDFITYYVAKQSNDLINTFGYTGQIFPMPNHPAMAQFVNGRHVARIIEGCNAISVIILFVSFVLAFAKKIKTTFLFILSGVSIIYVLNILRVSLLCIGLYEYPESQALLHDILFPLVIYGVVLCLWVIWVKIVLKAKGNEE